jgi:hypothetical protein
MHVGLTKTSYAEGDGRERGGTATRFPPGVSANPGGRPSLEKPLAALGETTDTARAKWWAAALPIAFAGPQSDDDKNWRYAHKEVGDRLMGKPKEIVEHRSELTDEEYVEELRLIAVEQIRAMPADERIRLLADPAPTDTIQ